MKSEGEIEIRDFSFPCIVGELPHERLEPQPLVFTIRYEYDFSVPATNDDIKNAVDYVELCQRIQSYCTAKKFRLLETLTMKTAYHVLDTFPVLHSVEVFVSKPEALPGKTISSARFKEFQK